MTERRPRLDSWERPSGRDRPAVQTASRAEARSHNLFGRISRNASRRLGLTVIQLVAVCFVITVLLLLLGPFLLRKREAARRALCVSNLKQLGLGIAQYYCDHNTNAGPEGMPPMANVNTFARHLDMYIGSEARLFFCPVDRQRRPTTNITNLTQSSYAIVTNAVWQSATEAPLLLDQFQPTGIAVMTGSNRWSRASSAHKDGGHVLWTDGHVDWNTSLDVGTNRYPVAND